MGSVHKATCDCGFQVDIAVGGTMAGYRRHAAFPFHCGRCGLVGANTVPAVPRCPRCRSAEIQPYGRPPVSLDSGAGTVLGWGAFSARATGNLCPNCQKMTLVFHRAHIMFD